MGFGGHGVTAWVPDPPWQSQSGSAWQPTLSREKEAPRFYSPRPSSWMALLPSVSLGNGGFGGVTLSPRSPPLGTAPQAVPVQPVAAGGSCSPLHSAASLDNEIFSEAARPRQLSTPGQGAGVTLCRGGDQRAVTEPALSAEPVPPSAPSAVPMSGLSLGSRQGLGCPDLGAGLCRVLQPRYSGPPVPPAMHDPGHFPSMGTRGVAAPRNWTPLYPTAALVPIPGGSLSHPRPGASPSLPATPCPFSTPCSMS